MTVSNAFSQPNYEKVKKFADEKDFEKAAAFIPEALKEKGKDLDFTMLCGDIYSELEKLDSALIMYTKAADIKEKPFVLRKLGKTQSILGKHNEAIQTLKILLKDNDKDINSNLELAQAYIRADSLKQAELIITRAINLDNKNPDAFIALGDLYFKQRVYELAKNNYEEALKLNENLLEAREKLAISYYWLATRETDSELRNKLFFRSLEEWNIITKQNPKNARAFFEQGKIFFFSNQYKPAAQSLYEFVQLRPSGSLGRWFLAQSLEKLGACDSAEQHLKIVAQEIDSVRKKAKLMLARCYSERKDYARTAEAYKIAAADTTLENIDLQQWGIACFNANDTANAIKIWKQAIENDPANNCRLMYLLGSQLYKLKMYNDAIYILNKRLTTGQCKDSLGSLINYFIGVSHLFSERPDSALIALKNSVVLDSTFLFSHIYLGDIYAKMKETKSAENEFLYVIENGAKDTVNGKNAMLMAYPKLCGLKLDDKKYAELVKIGKQYAETFPEAPYAYLYVAIAYHSSGDKENACLYYKKVLKIDPKNKTALDNKKNLQCE